MRLFFRKFSNQSAAEVVEGRILGWHRSATPDLSPRVKVEGNTRVGLVAMKIGMTRMWDKFSGEGFGCTVLQVRENHVIQVRKLDDAGYVGLLVGGGDKPWPHKPRERAMLDTKGWLQQQKREQMVRKCREAGVPFKRHICKFRVTLEGLLPAGTPLDVSHLRVGQYVDVFGFTKDKGFQGVMKRWGFHGMPASHGQTKTHRKMGNVASSGLARVWKGTKMPGHMGDKPKMSWARQVVRVNRRLNLVYLRGTVSGTKEESWVQIRDSYKTPPGASPLPIPYPTCHEPEGPGDVFCTDVYSPGEQSFRFQLDTSRMCKELLSSVEARKKHLADFDVPLPPK